MTWIILCLLVVIACFIAWNFYPPLRARMSGMSTWIETTVTGGLYYFGILAEGVKEAQEAGYLPTNIVGYVPYLLMAYILLKRLQTTKPVKVPLLKK